VGRIYVKKIIKVELLQKIVIFIDMGRPKKIEEDKKIKIGISLDRTLYNTMMKNGGKVSRIIENIIREHYGNKDLL